MRPLNGQEIYSNRLKKLYSVLKDLDKTGFIILKYEDIYYLTGFYGKDSDSMLIISSDKQYLLVNFIYYEDARASVKNKTEYLLKS